MALLLSRDDVVSLLSMKDCLAAVETAFAEHARGKAVMPQRAVIKIEDQHGLFLGMPAYIGGDQNALGLKVVTVYPDNPVRHDLPTTLGTLMLCDPATGKVIAIMDAGYLTAVRTGAASGVATKYLARKDAQTCAVFGAGVQARKQLEAMCLVRPITQALVIDTAADVRDRFAAEMTTELGIAVTATEDSEAAVRGADIVITASSSPTPVFDGHWLQPGTHINNIGSHAPTTRELDTVTIQRSRYVADLAEANLAEAGDLLIPIQEGAVSAEHISASLGDIVSGQKPGRESEEEITLFKSVGLAIQDMSTALAVFKAAQTAGAGVEFPF